jgi:hypothetical protein
MFHLQNILLFLTSLISISVAASFFEHRSNERFLMDKSIIEKDVDGFAHAFVGSSFWKPPENTMEEVIKVSWNLLN